MKVALPLLLVVAPRAAAFASSDDLDSDRLARVLGRRVEVEVDASASSSEPQKKKSLDASPEDKYYDDAVGALSRVASTRLGDLLRDTESDECRELVTSRFVEVYSRLLREDWLPFETTTFKSECPPSSKEERSNSISAASIRLCYVVMAHEEPNQVKRLVEALREPKHSFVVHVDAKSEATFRNLKEWSSRVENVVVIEDRLNVTWGGYNVVRGTLNAIRTALSAFEFDWIVSVSGYTYPLVSNEKIRETLAEFPANSEFFEIRPQPNQPSPRAWHQFVECDNKMRRIYRLTTPNNIKMYMGSQWFMMTPQFAEYVTRRSRRGDEDGRLPSLPSDSKRRAGASFAENYELYGQYTMVADENYFVTVLKNSPFCGNHVNDNFLHVQFDRWENEKDDEDAVSLRNKCLQPNPRHCGRSPTTLTLDYLPVLELGGALFARKFDSRKDASILDAIDEKRARPSSESDDDFPHFSNVRIAWRPHHYQNAPVTELCVSVSQKDRKATLVPCGGQSRETIFNLGPCSRDGNITLSRSTPAAVSRGEYAPAPFCPIYVADKKEDERRHLCLDLEKERIVPGTSIIGYPCSGRWNQLFGFGTSPSGHHDDRKPTTGHVFISIPYAFHQPKELCLEADLPHLKVMACDPNKVEQLFHVEYAPLIS